MAEAVLGAHEGLGDGCGGGQVDAVVGRAQHGRRPHPAQVQQRDPGRGGRRDKPRRCPRTDAVAGDGQPHEPSVGRAFQGVGQEEGARVPQLRCGYIEFVDRPCRDDGGEGHGTLRAERVAADEEAFDTASVVGGGEQRVGEDGHPGRVEPGLYEVEGAQRPCGRDEFGRRPPSSTAQRVALEPHPGDDLRRGPQLVGDPAGATGRDPVAAEVERLDLTAAPGHGLGPSSPSPSVPSSKCRTGDGPWASAAETSAAPSAPNSCLHRSSRPSGNAVPTVKSRRSPAGRPARNQSSSGASSATGRGRT
ncbi:hypothetical protein N7U49_39345 [Streptomyces sp. AD2-2]|nr:hypothetical protein N7U49_39345 [Streptomyces sp. AD2-2]